MMKINIIGRKKYIDIAEDFKNQGKEYYEIGHKNDKTCTFIPKGLTIEDRRDSIFVDLALCFWYIMLI